MRGTLLTAVFVAVALGCGLGVASRADAYVYWTNSDGIGRANLDGSGANQSFITGINADANAEVMAVDGAHVYWTHGSGVPEDPYAIGRANLDGSGVNQSFITGLNATFLSGGLAVDGAHVYWTEDIGEAPQQHIGAMGRANLDGSAVDQNFITGQGSLYGIAVDGAHIYWAGATSETWANHDSGHIGRANLDGSGADRNFIPADYPNDVAVDGAHIYWNSGVVFNPPIGRANLDGSGANQTFLSGLEVNAGDIAVDRAHIYWSQRRRNTEGAIGRANLDGSAVNGNFIYGNGGDYGDLAVDALGPPPPPVITFTKKQGVNNKHRYVVVKASCSAPCAKLVATGKVTAGTKALGALRKVTKTPNGARVTIWLQMQQKFYRVMGALNAHKTVKTVFNIKSVDASGKTLGTSHGTISMRRRFH
jgi:hypothetical protein